MIKTMFAYTCKVRQAHVLTLSTILFINKFLKFLLQISNFQ
ncbi:unnamed protein product [Acanthoscelides obtectus]|uniref:Uncharacterized protein n=1 Tax=Acanthoscelides obtectus TaxID=200917 RepID=A0A9P0M3U4_ACAOB|nr:unnamed protein product [Acanthoscelides obtectus]CAK1627281.1 hypothetical protein AOBTE_LOCUS4477 [Acanthoscelides obtectus]